jgi:hypothetical protein
MNNAEILRAVRDTLRALHTDALEEIELVIVRALDRIAEEAVVWGANEQHDFRTDAAAAAVLKSIERELEQIVAGLLRKVGGNE